jgi:hypothetical protein
MSSNIVHLLLFVFLGNLSVPIIKIDLTCLFYAVWEVQKEDSCRRFEQKMEASYTEYNSTLLNFFYWCPIHRLSIV